jgi:hypothetical protein
MEINVVLPPNLCKRPLARSGIVSRPTPVNQKHQNLSLSKSFAVPTCSGEHDTGSEASSPLPRFKPAQVGAYLRIRYGRRYCGLAHMYAVTGQYRKSPPATLSTPCVYHELPRLVGHVREKVIEAPVITWWMPHHLTSSQMRLQSVLR